MRTQEAQNYDLGFKMAAKSDDDVAVSVPAEALIWSEEEASERQIEQVGVSACGATAALNVLVYEIQ